MDLKSDEIRQNLIDAGCNEDTIARFFDSSETRERLNILNEQRTQLLDAYHLAAKKIDCLDHLVYRLENRR